MIRLRNIIARGFVSKWGFSKVLRFILIVLKKTIAMSGYPGTLPGPPRPFWGQTTASSPGWDSVSDGFESNADGEVDSYDIHDWDIEPVPDQWEADRDLNPGDV